MGLFCILNKLDEVSLQEIRINYIKSYTIDLDALPLYYEKENEEDIKNNTKKIGIEITDYQNTDYNSYNKIQLKYNKDFYNYFEKYEKLNNELNKLNPYKAIKEEINKEFGLDILQDCIDNKISNEEEQLKSLKEMYGIELSSSKEVADIGNSLDTLEKDFYNEFGYDINTSYVKCWSPYQSHKQEKAKIWSKANDKLRTIKDKNHISYFEYYWKIISCHDIGTISTLNTIYRYPELIFPGHRMDSLYKSVEVTETSETNKILQLTMDEYLIGISKRGNANYINDQLDFLTSTYNDYMKIAVLLDLYWNFKALLSNTKKVKLDTYNLEKVECKENAAFQDNKYFILESRKYKINSEINNLKSNSKILYPFTLDVHYDSKQKTMAVPEAFAEIHLNAALNKHFIKFFTNNFNLICKSTSYKHKTFEDANIIYSKQFSYNQIQDYYCLESIMGLNLSMKLYDYIWPLYVEILNSELHITKEVLFQDYINPIIATLFKIKSPYLRLRIADLVLQPYGYSKYIQKERNLLSLMAIRKIINKYADSINSSYKAIFTAMFYYYGKHLLSTEDNLKGLEDLEELINNEYKPFIRIDAASIEADIPSSNQNNEFGLIWNELLQDKRGNQRDLYSYIMQGILINNKQSE